MIFTIHHLLSRIGKSISPKMARNSKLIRLASVSITIVLLNNLFSVNSSAANKVSQELSLRDCIQLALENDLGFQVSKISPELARHQLDLSLMAYDPSFRISTDFTTSSSPGGVDDQNRAFAGTETTSERVLLRHQRFCRQRFVLRHERQPEPSRRHDARRTFRELFRRASFTLRQPLLRNAWIDSTRLNIRVNRNGLRSSELGLKDAIMRLVTRVERTYYDLILARDRVRVQEQALALTEELLRANKRRVEVGVMAPLDEKQTESQVAARQSSLRSAQRGLIAQAYSLKRMLTDDIATWRMIDIEPTEKLIAIPQTFDLHESWGIALRQRPDVVQSRIGIENDGLNLKFRKTNFSRNWT